MEKMLTLSSCNGCPFVGNIEISNHKRSDYCFKVHRKLKSSEIPDWCPLPDAPPNQSLNSDPQG